MQEAKQTFPGNTISDGLFKLSAFTFAFLFFVSATEGRFQSGTEFFGIDGTYFHLVGLAMVATLSYQHKAVFTKKAGEGKVHFWKQFTPYFVYARREIDVKDLSYWIKKTTSTDTETGRNDSSYRTYVYEGNKKIFVYDDKTDYFREILGKGPRRANDEMDLGMKIFLPILFVVGVGFLVIGYWLFTSSIVNALENNYKQATGDDYATLEVVDVVWFNSSMLFAIAVVWIDFLFEAVRFKKTTAQL